MKTPILFFFFHILVSSLTMAGNGVAHSDTAALPQPDSARPAQPTLTLRGDIELTKNFSVVRSEQGASEQNTPWYLMGYLTLNTHAGWTIPLQSFWSSNGYGQAYNAIGASPSYKKWLTLHAGHRNLEFSPFTLAGNTISISSNARAASR